MILSVRSIKPLQMSQTTIQRIEVNSLTTGIHHVRVVRCVSPTLFFVQPRESTYKLQELQVKLNKEMEEHSENLIFRLRRFQTGEVVAVKEKKIWKRGIITHIQGIRASVDLRDWGHSVTRSVFRIYLLKERFCTLPWQTIPCGLAYASPIISTRVWPTQVNELFRILAEHRDGWIKIRASGNVTAFVDLEITNPGDFRYTSVRRQMEDLGYLRCTNRIAVDVFPAI